ncbi:glycerol-3-phosphate dehydrogenase (NAD(P)+) [Ketogulonicigenium robustum]|uniref:Glycerol-3-phosphate dehydrogenase [NAD(P)+] n=1 Tax=Ketogulonicigenium robustum TaxID=92947 RepID=A0A1W6P2G6_9RHOB|nr:NAD(P)H-dependent glycerol-3-phosphate dehydrogenase [Ketogulonicigenium robustum]ARO15623.1 glycerol-3-phosphate dehydrogenase (NAD(P)+) [Ketogulonicigenium robustum]
MTICIVGAGAFGTALAVTLARATPDRIIHLWVRDITAETTINWTGESPRLPGVPLPKNVHVTSLTTALSDADTILLATPAQALRPFLDKHASLLAGRPLVACAKGIDLTTLEGPSATIAAMVPDATPAILTGPSFAADIARGLPTALTLACADDAVGAALQEQLSTPTLRLYRTTDLRGAELGGALKNVMAIACGATIGAGFGDSARAALMTRGYAEMQRMALALGAGPETLAGLSGFGDLVLTCTSDLSRNYRFGLALGQGRAPDSGVTVEGVATADAAHRLAQKLGIDMPITAAVAQLARGEITPADAMQDLLARPLKEE